MPEPIHTPDTELLAELTKAYGRYIPPTPAAKAVGTSRRTLERMAERGELPLYRIGRARSYRFRTSDIAALVVRVA